MAIRTGDADFSFKVLATQWASMGWCGVDGDLGRKDECYKKLYNGGSHKWVLKPEFKDNYSRPPVFDTEEMFFKWLGLEWVEPENRNMDKIVRVR